MSHLRTIHAALCLMSAGVATSPVWADVARPPEPTKGWPGWAVASIAIVLFLGVIYILSRFVRGDRGDNNKDDGGGLFGP